MESKIKANKIIVAKVFTIIGLVLVVAAFGVFLGTNSVLLNQQTIRFDTKEGYTIVGMFYPGNKPTGIVIFHGLGEDQNSMKSITSELVRVGFPVLTIDFSGHGRSGGIIFANDTLIDLVSDQVLLAKEQFKTLTGLNDSNIILFGHSLGANAILRATVNDYKNVSAIILLGPICNFNPTYPDYLNIRTSNWSKDFGPVNPATDLLIIGSKNEDVFPVDGAYYLFERLSNQTASDHISVITPEGYIRELDVFDHVFHTYEMLSPQIIKKIKTWSIDISGIIVDKTDLLLVDTKIAAYYFSVLGMLLAIIFGNIWLNNTTFFERESPDLFQLKILSMKKYFLFKPLIWLGGVVLGLAITMIFLLLPIGIPTYALVYFSVILGYGVISFILYSTNKMPGVEGRYRFSFKEAFDNIEWQRILLGLGIAALFIIFATVFINSGFYRVYPGNIKLLWLVLFTIFSSIGFHQLLLETEVIRNNFQNKRINTFYNYLIYFAPIALILLVIAATGYYFILFDAFNELVIVVTVVFFGEFLKKIIKNRLVTAIIMSFILYFLSLSRGPLISIFFS